MQLQLHKVIPKYMAPRDSSDVFGRELTFGENRHVHIVSPSGRGKTSLIHFLYGLRKDYYGNISFDGQDIKSLGIEKLSRYRQQEISIVFQDLRLFGELTARENIEIKHRLHPFHKPERIEEMAGMLGITEKLAQKAATCSYGEQQRIAIIRALTQPFNTLLLDEPFSHLDPSNHEKALALIREECAARNAMMILADLRELESLRDEQILHL